MPVKNILRTKNAIQYYKNSSYESLVASWLMHDGWEVFIPNIDHDMKTDLLISDGQDYYRIQVKTLDSCNENCAVENKWGNAKIDYVVYFSRSANWGYIIKPFGRKRKKLNAKGHIRFHQHAKPFNRAFEQI